MKPLNIPSGYVAKFIIKLLAVLEIISTLPNQNVNDEYITEILTTVNPPKIENNVNNNKFFKFKP